MVVTLQGARSSWCRPKVVGTEGANLERTSLNGLNTQTVGDDFGNSQRISSNGLNSQMVGDVSGNSQRSNANGLNSQMVGDASSNSQRSNANGINSQMAGVEGGNSQVNFDNSQLNIGSNQSSQDPPKRGTSKMCRTKYKIPPHSGRVQLEPIGHWIEYSLGKIKEFTSTFTSHPRHRARAAKNLENYLVKRVTNMMYQVRLEAVKKWCHRNNKDCDDTRARTIELTEEQYLTCRVEWCNGVVWALLAKYWTSDEYKKKRCRGQQSRMSCDDPAQNRGDSRNFCKDTTVLDMTNACVLIILDEYMTLALDANSQELEGRALYTIGRGMKHGRVPIGDGVVDKAIVLAHSKSISVRPPDPDHYESVEPPAELLQRLQDLDARRHQVLCSWLLGHMEAHSVDERRSNDNANDEDDDDDYSYHESDDDDCSYHQGIHHVQYSNEDDDDDHIEDDDDDGCLEDGDDSSSSQSDDDHRSTKQ
ncbi:unnamed protein product [Miscanthus lutarioriparius]|uniref:Uncharacterized protein n=1 Tax=Miscanthus lutarioriparius TaxID=422564 RepID=A0A811SBL2_9POAL|nr:unnamed protein product [Miscanthus lutarioriparius]